MRISIRQGAFETNSSSAHAIVIMSERDYEIWQSEKSYLDLSDELDDPYIKVVPWASFVDEETAYNIGRNGFWQSNIEDVHNLIANGQIPYDIVEQVESGKDMYPLVNAFLVKYKDWVDKPMVQLQLIIEN